eukprot:6209052-Pleurochrysis_carterae.AAC.6
MKHNIRRYQYDDVVHCTRCYYAIAIVQAINRLQDQLCRLVVISQGVCQKGIPGPSSRRSLQSNAETIRSSHLP